MRPRIALAHLAAIATKPEIDLVSANLADINAGPYVALSARILLRIKTGTSPRKNKKWRKKIGRGANGSARCAMHLEFPCYRYKAVYLDFALLDGRDRIQMPAWLDLRPRGENGSNGRACQKPLASPSSLRASSEWGCRGSRYQSPARSLSIKKGTSYAEHVTLSGGLPFPMSDRAHGLPQDARDALSFIAGDKSANISTFRRGEDVKLESAARRLLLELQKIRTSPSSERRETRAKLSTLLPEGLLKLRDMGGAYWCDQFINDLPKRGVLAELGKYPCPLKKVPNPISTGQRFQAATARFETARGAADANAPRLWNGAFSQVAEGWLRGPHVYTAKEELISNGKATVANPAYRFGAQQADELRAVDDLKKSITNEATAVRGPINLPPRGRGAHKLWLKPILLTRTSSFHF